MKKLLGLCVCFGWILGTDVYVLLCSLVRELIVKAFQFSYIAEAVVLRILKFENPMGNFILSN